jgi:hypothetical protein
MAAVPALIDALGDREAGVRFDANEALKTVTGQNFAQNQAARWRKWYESNKPAGTGLPPDSGPRGERRLDVIVRERGYNPPTLRFSLPKDAKLEAGMTVELLRGGERLGAVKLTMVMEQEAVGKLLGAEAGVQLGPLDQAVIQVPK